jgi:hypothetical protein
LTPEEK